MDTFFRFTQGCRTLFLLHRTKEGAASQAEGEQKKMIVQNEYEFKEALCTLLELKHQSNNELRIYSSVNSRNMEKAIRKFKFSMLESDYYDEENRLNFYLDIKNRFFSSLMNPESRKTSYFLIDCDSEAQTQAALTKCAELNIHIHQVYGTKNGTHIITAPFNQALFQIPEIEIHKDGLLLLKY